MVKRTQRLEPVDRLARTRERDCARRLAGAQQRVADAEQRCVELERYRDEYHEAFRARALSGLQAKGLREFQAFIARLDEALRQQRQLVAQLRSEQQRERQQWQDAAVRSSAVGKVIERARHEERLVEDRRLQRELDERAQHQGGRR
jgi:flagellar FliJ protein